jgi:hypothetical protein
MRITLANFYEIIALLLVKIALLKIKKGRGFEGSYQSGKAPESKSTKDSSDFTLLNF